MALVVLAVRLLILAGRTDELQLDRYGGTVAQAYLVGLPLDPSGLPVIPHLRGSYLFGLLLVPLTAIFGPTLMTLKLIAIVWSLLTLWVLVRVTDLALGRSAAWLAGLLYAFAPPALQMVDLLALGSHADTLLPILWPLAWLLSRGWKRPFKSWEAGVFGLLIGFGLFFSMQCWVSLPALLAVWWRCDPRPWKQLRALWVLLGAIPLTLLVPVVTKSATLVNRPIEGRFLPKGIGGAFKKLWTVLSSELRLSWLFEGSLGLAASWLLFAVFLSGALMSLGALLGRSNAESAPLDEGPAPSGRALLATFGWLHCGALFAAYAISDFQVNLDAHLDGMGSRYLFPIWPALTFLALVGFGAGLRGGIRMALPLGAAIASGALGVVSLAAPGSVGSASTMLSHEPYACPWHFRHAAPEDLDARWDWVIAMDPNWQIDHPQTYARCFFDPAHEEALKRAASQLSAATRSEHLARALLATTKREVRAWRPEVGRAIAAGSGGEVVAKLVLEGKGDLDQLHAKLEPFCTQAQMILGPELGAQFLRGMGHNLHAAFAVTAKRRDDGKGPKRSIDQFLSAIGSLPDPGRKHILEGVGFKLGLRISRFARTSLLTIEGYRRLPAPIRETIVYWAGRGYRVRFLESDYSAPRSPDLEALMGPEEQFIRAWRNGLEARPMPN